MPIRDEDRPRYPADWRQISQHVRFTRAAGRCECLGECGTVHVDGRCLAVHGGQTLAGGRVVLTTAHLDHTPENVDLDNLRAFCQACHLRYDRDHHAETRARTRAQREGRLL